jgi:hypothetical protein
MAMNDAFEDDRLLEDLEAPSLSFHPKPSIGLRRWLLLTLLVAFTMIARGVAWHLGLAIPQRLMSAGAAVLLLLALAMAARSAVFFSQEQVPPQHAYPLRLFVLTAWILLLVALGCLRGNLVNMIFKDTIGFLILVFLLLLGRYDTVWKALRKPLVILFYVSFALILLTYRMPGLTTDLSGNTSVLQTRDIGRNLNTIGASLNLLMGSGLLLGAWGLVRQRTDTWRILMIGALPVYSFVEAGLFEFRGALITVALLLVSFVVPLSILRRRFPFKAILALAIVVVGVIGFLFSRGDELGVMRRFEREDNIFASRIEEANTFFDDMQPIDLVIGRGMGGWYVGPIWATGAFVDGKPHWTANHFGFLAFVLRGGFPMLLFMATFVAPIVMPKSPLWRRNEYNLAAAVLTPVLLFNIIANPVVIDPDGFFGLMLWGLCFARFSTPPHDDSGAIPLDEGAEALYLHEYDERPAGAGIHYADVN